MIKCDICHFKNPDGFAYCGRCGNGLSHSEEMTDNFSGALEGERKQVTIIFADISGFTALNDAAKTPGEVEKVLQIVNHSLHMLSEVVYEYDGYIDKYLGDAIMAVFGAPRSHEDDPERALRAALSMRERLKTFNRNPPFPLAEELGIHLGINTGTVIAGLIGTKRKRSYTVMGDAVNVASRLEGVSERGEILVSQDTYHLTNRLFKFKEREPVFVKGKKEALEIFELERAKHQYATQRGIAGLRSPMVGRGKQFSALKDQIANTRQGKGGIAVVVGEAGLGKSRLVSELQQQSDTQAANIFWLEGRGLSYRQNQSYKLFIEIFRKYLNAGPDEPGDLVWQKLQAIGPDLFGLRQNEIIPYLAILMGIKLDEKLTQNMPLSDPLILQQRMFVAVGEWVEAVASQKPVILVFEDLHWADSNSVALIEFLMTITPQLPLLLICITRPDKETEFWQKKKGAAKTYRGIYHEFTLSPLTQQQSRSLVDQLLQVEKLPKTLEQLILSRSEGNPLFMEEVLRSLIEEETLIKKDGSWVMARPVKDVNIPETLTGVLTSRIDRLDEPVKRTLQIASVVGRVFSQSVLAAVCSDVAEDSDQLEEFLSTLTGAELVRERVNDAEQEYIFKHVLTYETTYNTLLVQQRRVYHKRIADHMAPMYYLKGEEYAGIVAHHYEQGEVWGRALTYLIRAAEASKTTFDNINAVDFYTKALDVSKLVDNLEPKTLINLYEGRGGILKRLGKIEEAQEDFERALKLAKSNEILITQMRVLGELGKLNAGHQKFSLAAPYFEDALKIARQLDDKKGLVDTLNQLGDFLFNMGQLNQCSSYFHEALEIAQTLNHTRRIGNSQDGLAAVILYQGEISAGIERLEKTANTWRDIGNYQGLMRTYGYLATGYSLQANYTRSNLICSNAIDLQERTGDLSWAPNFSYHMAQNAFERGNLSSAHAHFIKTIEFAGQLGNGIWQSMGLAGCGYYLLFIGEREQAMRQIEQAVQFAEQTGSPLWTSRARRILGIAHWLSDNLSQAQTILETELNQMRIMGFATDQVEILSALLELHIEQGHWNELPSLLEAMTALTIPSEMKACHAKALMATGKLQTHNEHYEAAMQSLIQALNIAQSTGNKQIELAAEIALIEPSSRLNRKQAARSHLERAESLFKAMAVSLEDKAAQTRFLAATPLLSPLVQAREIIPSEE